MVRRRFELDLAGAKQRAERDAEEARRAAFEARDAHIRRGRARPRRTRPERMPIPSRAA